MLGSLLFWHRSRAMSVLDDVMLFMFLIDVASVSQLSRGSHNTQPRKERKIKEHNTGMTETRAARVEQKTRHKAEPSTLSKYIDALK